MLSPRRFFFGDLHRPVAYVLLTVAFGGWLMAMSSFSHLWGGGPAPGQPGCPYALDNHGSITCVTKGTYDEAGAAEQSLAGGVALAFYCVHLGAALGALGQSTKRPTDALTD